MALYSELLHQLQNRQPLPPLYPSEPWSEELSSRVLAAADAELFGPPSRDASQAGFRAACRAGLLLWNDDLEASHTVSQGIETATGSFWHAIMHRREGDAANSHYWWRRTGQHPAFGELYANVMQLLDEDGSEPARALHGTLEQAGTWLPMEFVARCELARRGALPVEWLQRIQVTEMETLLAWCHGHAA